MDNTELMSQFAAAICWEAFKGLGVLYLLWVAINLRGRVEALEKRKDKPDGD